MKMQRRMRNFFENADAEFLYMKMQRRMWTSFMKIQRQSFFI